jgi:RHS repeat-associated protein
MGNTMTRPLKTPPKTASRAIFLRGKRRFTPKKARKPLKTPPAVAYRGIFFKKKYAVKEPDPETGLYYYGARYLDPKTSRWLSGDPALGEYLPVAPLGDEEKKRNQNLPGMGGVFNVVNLHAYHYAGNNPVKYVDPDGEVFWVPLVILGVVALGTIVTMRSSEEGPPREVNITRTMNKLGSADYGAPKNNMPTFRDANSRNRDSKHSIKIGNNILAAVGASLPTGGLGPDNYNDGRAGRRRDAMNALGLAGEIAGRAINSDGYFAGDVIFEVYKTDGKVTNWAIKEAYTLADGTKGYVEYRQEEALKYIEGKKIYLNELGILDKVNNALGL